MYINRWIDVDIYRYTNTVTCFVCVCVCKSERVRERDRVCVRESVCIPNHTVMPGFALHKKTCLYEQVLPAELAPTSSLSSVSLATEQLCCSSVTAQVLSAELARSVIH